MFENVFKTFLENAEIFLRGKLASKYDTLEMKVINNNRKHKNGTTKIEDKETTGFCLQVYCLLFCLLFYQDIKLYIAKKRVV